MNMKKDKDLKTRIRYGNSFDIQILQQFKELSKETGIPISKLFDRAMINLLKEYGKYTDEK